MQYRITVTQFCSNLHDAVSVKKGAMNQPTPVRARGLRDLAVFFACLLTGVGCARAAAGTPPELDPLHTDGDKYRALLDNPLLRVLRYHDLPGASTRPHRHPCFVMYALGPFERKLTFADGSQRLVTFRGGEAVWMPAQQHAGQNVGDTPTDALLIELKGPCA
jgi:hypothetical protein